MKKVKLLNNGDQLTIDSVIASGSLPARIGTFFNIEFRNVQEILLLQNLDGTIFGVEYISDVEQIVELNEVDGLWCLDQNECEERCGRKLIFETISDNHHIVAKDCAEYGIVVNRKDYDS